MDDRARKRQEVAGSAMEKSQDRGKGLLRSRTVVGLAALAAVALWLIGGDAFAYDDYGRPLYSSSDSDYQDVGDGEYIDDEYVVADDIPDFNSPYALSSGSEGYGYFSPNGSPELGSNAWLDAETSAIQERRSAAGKNGILEATSGRGTTPKKVQSKGLFGYAVENNARDGENFYDRWIAADSESDAWSKQILPVGLMYPSYLASRKESRLQSIITYANDYGTLWDVTLGGRAPIFRYGNKDITQPEGWEIELEGAALLRLDWERDRNLAATDYRAGVPIVYGTRRWQVKTGYYHVSSHLGDNYLMDAFRPRVHYSRDAVMLGLAVKPTDDVRLYAEVDYAFHCAGAAKPWEIQIGAEYSPEFTPTTSNWSIRPFLASHGHLYEERDFGGYWSTQTGIQWRSPTNSLLRIGAEYFMGGDDLYQFHKTFQRKIGGGLWYDF